MSDNIGLQIDPPKGVKETMTSLDELVRGIDRFERSLNKRAAANKTGLEELLAKLPTQLTGVATALKGAMSNLQSILDGGEAKVVNNVRAVNRAVQAAFEQRLTLVGTMSDREIASWRRYGVSLNALQKAQLADSKTLAAEKAAVQKAQLTEAAAYAASIDTLERKTAKAMKTATVSGYKNAGPSWWEAELAKQDKGVALLAAEYDKSIATLEKKTAQVIKATTVSGYLNAGPAWWEAELAKQAKGRALLVAEYDKSIATLERKTAQVLKASTVTGYTNAGPGWWAKALADQEKALIGTSSSISGPLAGRQLGTAATSKLDAEMAATVNRELSKTPAHAGAAGAALHKLALDGNDVHSAMRGLASGFNLLWLTWGNLVPLFAGAAISNGFMQVIKQGSEVAHTMKIIEVLGGNTAGEMSKLNAEMVRLATSGPYGPMEVADAMKTLSLAGMKANEILATTTDVLNFAVAGTTDLKTAAETLVSISTAFGMGAGGFGRVADVISKTAAESKSSVESISNAMKTASVINAQYGVSLVDTATGIATLSQLGIEGTAAGTALRNMYADLSGRSKQVANALKSQGIEMRTATGDFRPMLEVVAELNTKLHSLTGIAQKDFLQTILSERGAKGMIEYLRLINESAEGAGKNFGNALAVMRASIEDSYGFAAVSAAKLAQTAENQWKSVKATFSTTMVEAFAEVEPQLLLIAQSLKDLARSPDFIEGLKSMTQAVATFVQVLVDTAGFVVKHGEAIAVLAVSYTAVRLLVRNLAAEQAAAAATTAAATAATLAQAAANTKLAASGAATGAGLAATARFLPGLGTAISLVTGAWMLYDYWVNKSRNTTAEAAGQTSQNILSSLDKEAARLDKINGLLRQGLTMKQAQDRLTSEAAATSYKGGFAAVTDQADKAQQSAWAAYTAKANSGLSGRDHERSLESLAKKAKAATAVYEQALRNEENAELAYITKARAVGVKEKEKDDILAKQLKDATDAKRLFGSLDFDGKGGSSKKAGASRFNEILKGIDAFKAGTADMEKSLAKLTVAETFENGSMAALDSLYRAGTITLKQYASTVAELAIAKASRDSAVEVVAANDLAKSVNVLNAKLREQVVTQHSQTEAEKLSADVKRQLAKTTDTLAMSTLKGTEAMLSENLVLEDNLKRQKDLAKLKETASKSIEDISATITAMEEQAAIETDMEAARAAAMRRGPEYVAGLEAETRAREKNAKQIAKTTIEATKLAEAMAIAMSFGEDVDTTKLEQLLAEIRRLNEATDASAVAAYGNAFNKALTIDRDRIAGDLADAVMVGLTEGGEKGAKALRDVLVKEFLTKPIQVWIKATISEIMGGSNAAKDSEGGSLTGISSIDNILGSATKLANTYLGKGNMLTDFTMSKMGETLGLSTANPMRYSAAADGLVANGNTLTTAGELFRAMPIGGMITAYTKGGVGGFVQGAANIGIAGAVTGGAAAASAGTSIAAGAMGGAGSALAAVPGWGWAAMAALAILGNKGEGYVRSTGESNVGFDATGAVTHRTADRYGVDNKNSDKFAEAVAATYFDVAKSLGVKGSALEVGYGSSVNEQGLQRYRLGVNMGGKNIYDSGENQATEEAVKLSATKAVISALKSSELPKSLQGMFDNVDISALDQIHADALMADAKGFKAIADAADALPFNSLTNASHETLVALTAASGGLEKLTANLTTYYARFYTEAERSAKSTDKIGEEFKRLGIETIPKTKEEFRALVERIGTATPEAAKLTAELYAMSGGFADMVDQADAQMAAMVSLNASLASVGASMYSLDTAGFAAANGLAAAAGGLANLQGLISSFSQGYFTEAEQRVNTVRSVTADLNAAGFSFTEDQVGSASRSDIRSAVQTAGQDIGTPDGQKRYVAALKAAQQLDGTLPKLAKAVETASGGGSSAGGAVNSIQDAWKTIVDSLWGEVKRIKGVIEETGPTAYVAAQARFAMTTAAARAGDQEAAKALPGVSQAVLKLAETNESTLVALKLMQGSVATSLIQTATQLSGEHNLTIPQFAVGTNYVPQDMLAMIHEGEAIIPKAYNPLNSGGSDNSELIIEVKALRLQVSLLQSHIANIDESTDKQAKILVSVTEDGRAMQTEAYS